MSESIKQAFLDKEGSCLRAWINHFDANDDGKITFDEFCNGLQAMAFQGDVAVLWTDIDRDGSGEITLEEIDQETADQWLSFRRWGATHFLSSKDMVMTLSGGSGKVVRSMFKDAVREAGWRGNFEDILFDSLDRHENGFLLAEELKFVDRERKKMKRKENAKAKASFAQNKRAKLRTMAARAISDFKRYLKKKFGHVVKAWLSAIDLDSSMSVQQKELFKACSRMGWTGDVRSLWRALDTDESGITGIEELDAAAAQELARFKEFCAKNWGSVIQAFRAFDRHGIKRLRGPEFVNAARQQGFEGDAKYIFDGVNYTGKKHVTEEDFAFLDSWKPPPWLTAEANHEAAASFRALLLKRYRHFLKAWRKLLDRDSSNRVNWHEFQMACARIGFPESKVAGAWRALDDDLSGFISLREIDESSHHILMSFKVWTDAEFGGIRSGFRVLDSDGSNELSFREFRRAVRDYGFEGDPKEIFATLGADGGGKDKVTLEEIVFLDDWELDDVVTEQDIADEEAYEAAIGKVDLQREGLTFATVAPGPGQYEIPNNIGGPQSAPCMKHNGAFSFRRKVNSMWSRSTAARQATPEPGPAHYFTTGPSRKDRGNDFDSHGLPPMSFSPNDWDSHGPSWQMPRGKRSSLANSKTPTGVGPGTYTVTEDLGNGSCYVVPAFSMMPRRHKEVHPQYKHQAWS